MEIIIAIGIICLGVAIYFNRKDKKISTETATVEETLPQPVIVETVAEPVVEAPVAKAKVAKTKTGYTKVSRAKKEPGVTTVAEAKPARKPRAKKTS